MTEVIQWIILLFMITVVELSEFVRRSKKLLIEDESRKLVNYLVFGKSEKANLSKAERNELAKLTRILLETYGGEI
ncbi:hypothetical protein MNBD_CHLOROFLEXI01-4603 [hydrothermal vent metagenome]|uniref:Uncharacterized protein n=1 Tax=hydrothermal vent metagenome TaxID=652676 RepID=A0A3B0VGL6_9ZZZZ